MNKELEFPWKYFVDTGLKMRFFLDGHNINEIVRFSHINPNEEYKIYFNGTHKAVRCKLYMAKPLVVNPKNLSDEDWLWIVKGHHENSYYQRVERIGNYITVYHEDEIMLKFNIELPHTSKMRQEQFNRFYSLHSIPNYEELLKAGVIEDAGDVYETK